MEKVQWGTVVGTNNGVEAYSNYKPEDGYLKNYVNGVYTGNKYQCVEYARRWLILVKNITIPNVGCACEIWDLKTLENLTTGQKTPLVRIPNGCSVPPQIGALLIYKRRFSTPVGHIGIITDVNLNAGYIRVSEQNVDDTWWTGDFARELKLENHNNGWWIRDTLKLYGCMAYENIPNIPQSGSDCVIF